MYNMRGFSDSSKKVIKDRRERISRKKINAEEIGRIASKESNKKAEERLKARIDVQGNGKYIDDGSKDRLAQIPYEQNKYEKKDDQQSYWYGYYIRGSRVLAGFIENTKMSEDQIRKIGYNDYYLGVSKEAFSELNHFPAYLKGYDEAAVEDIVKGIERK